MDKLLQWHLISISKCHFTSIGIPTIQIRQSHDHLIFIIGMPIPGKMVLYRSGALDITGRSWDFRVTTTCFGHKLQQENCKIKRWLFLKIVNTDGHSISMINTKSQHNNTKTYTLSQNPSMLHLIDCKFSMTDSMVTAVNNSFIQISLRNCSTIHCLYKARRGVGIQTNGISSLN